MRRTTGGCGQRGLCRLGAVPPAEGVQGRCVCMVCVCEDGVCVWYLQGWDATGGIHKIEDILPQQFRQSALCLAQVY